MRKVSTFAVLAAVASLAACAPPTQPPGAMPMSSAPTGPSAQAPTPPNSLPPGATVDAPLTSPTGTVGQTTVAPGTPGAYATDPNTVNNPPRGRRTAPRPRGY